MALSLYKVTYNFHPYTKIEQSAVVLAEDGDEAVLLVEKYNSKHNADKGFYNHTVDHLTSLVDAKRGTVLFCTAGKGESE